MAKSIVDFKSPSYVKVIAEFFEKANGKAASFTQQLNAFAREHYRTFEGMTDEILEQVVITEADARKMLTQYNEKFNTDLKFKKKTFKSTLTILDDEEENPILESIAKSNVPVGTPSMNEEVDLFSEDLTIGETSDNFFTGEDSQIPVTSEENPESIMSDDMFEQDLLN